MVSTYNSFVLITPITEQYLSNFTVREGQLPSLVLSDGTMYYGEIDMHSGLPHGNGVILFKHNINAYR